MIHNVSDNGTLLYVEKYGGRLKDFVHVCQNYASDPTILDIVQNCHIYFEVLPTQETVPNEIKFTINEEPTIDEEINKNATSWSY